MKNIRSLIFGSLLALASAVPPVQAAQAVYVDNATSLTLQSPTTTLKVPSGGAINFLSGAAFSYQTGATFSGDATEFRTDVGLAIGTNVQAWSANLDALDDYTPATLPVSTATTAAISVESSARAAADTALDARTTTAESNITTNTTAISLINSSLVGALSAANTLGTISALNQALTTPSGNSGKGYTVAIAGTLSGTNAPAVAVVVGGTVLSNGTVYNYYPPINIPADLSVTRAKLAESLGAPYDALAAILGTSTVSLGQIPLQTQATTLGGGSGTLFGTSTKVGTVTAVNLRINTAGTFYVVVLTGTAPSFTVKSISSLVTTASTGNVAFTASDFGTISVSVGDTIAINSPASGGILMARSANNARPSYFQSGAIGAVGSSATWTTVNNHDYHGNYTVTYAVAASSQAQLDSTLSAKIETASTNGILAAGNLLARRSLYSLVFGSSAPSGWTVGAGWTNTSTGLLSPTGISDFSQKSYLNELYSFGGDLRTIRFRFVPQGSGTRFAAGYRHSAGADSINTTIAQVDTVNSLLKIHAGGTTWATETSVLASTAIAALTTGREYALELERNQRINTARLIDMASGTTLATVSEGSNSTDISVTSSGEQIGGPIIINRDGQTLFKGVSVYGHPSRPRVYIMGDSLTNGYGLTLANRWASIIKAAIGGNAAVAAVDNAISTTITDRLNNEIPAFKPDWILAFYGANDQDAGLANFTARYDALRSYCSANGIKLAVGIIPPHVTRVFTNLNAYMLALTDVRHVRFDLAVTTGNDGVTINAANLQGDNLHFNSAGNALMATRVQLDLPEIFY